VSTTPDTEFRSAGDQWLFNLNTKNLAANTKYTYQIGLFGGTTIEFSISLR